MTELMQGASPNSIRYYYPASRAHHAYCMAVDFGMEFEQRSGKWSLEGLKHIDLASGYRIYIHPDSLHLLGPQVGDLYEIIELAAPNPEAGEEKYSHDVIAHIDRKVNCVWSEGVRLHLVSHWPTRWPHLRRKIIQRNGVAFHWPEREAA